MRECDPTLPGGAVAAGRAPREPLERRVLPVRYVLPDEAGSVVTDLLETRVTEPQFSLCAVRTARHFAKK